MNINDNGVVTIEIKEIIGVGIILPVSTKCNNKSNKKIGKYVRIAEVDETLVTLKGFCNEMGKTDVCCLFLAFKSLLLECIYRCY
ncbi:hypothetical protein B9K06_26500, partial [Bacillus sp. OG2]